MARQKKQDEPKKGSPAYMSTYGDMMTLLLTFFILLFSMSSIDTAKFSAFIQSFDGSVGLLDGGTVVVDPNLVIGDKIQPDTDKALTESEEKLVSLEAEMSETEKELEQFIQSNNLNNLVNVEKNGLEVVIRFDDVLLFDTGKAKIKSDGTEVLKNVAEKLREYTDNGFHLKFEGHTDNIPINNEQFPSNWELSASRAIAGAKFFIDEMGYSPESLSTEGFGEYRGIADNSTPEGRAMNRRMEIKITKPSLR